MSDIIKKAFENIDPEAEKRIDEKLKNGSELFGLYDVSNCDHSNEVQKQGDGFVYTVCGDCGKDLD
tara:strand:+ start:872 stop:1069 length:198 start_codon:yes stop_codon:yes gene_type:complete